jgi:hypothetical protein
LRLNIAGTDPVLMKEIEDLYESTMTKSARTRVPSLPLEDVQAAFPQAEEHLQSKYKSSFSSFSADSFDEKKEEAKKPTAPMSKINDSDFLSTY